MTLRLLIVLLVILGISFLFYALLESDLTESLCLSLCFITLGMFGLGLLHRFYWSLKGFAILAILGLCLCLIKVIRKKEKRGFFLKSFFSPAFLGMLFVYAVGFLLFRKGVLHLTQEFGTIALQIKELAESGLGGTSEVVDGYSLFFLFFRKTVGNQDAVLYIANFFLIFAGALLPLNRLCSSRKNYFKTTLYLFTIYAAIFTLFTQGFYNLYPELALAVWTGGVVAWWTMGGRKNNRTVKDNLLLFAFALMIFFLRKDTGFLAAAAVVGYVAAEKCMRERSQKIIQKVSQSKKSTSKTTKSTSKSMQSTSESTKSTSKSTQSTSESTQCSAAKCAAAMLLGFAGMMLVAVLFVNLFHIEQSALFQLFHGGCNFPAKGSYLSAVLGLSLGKSSRLTIGLIPAVFGFCVLRSVVGTLEGFEEEKRLQILFMSLFCVFYVIICFAWVSFLPGVDSSTLTGTERYLAVPAIAALILVLAGLENMQVIHYKKIAEYVPLFVLLFFLSGWTAKILVYESALDTKGTENASLRSETKKVLNSFKKLDDSDGKVLVLSADSAGGLPQAMGRYYLGDQCDDGSFSSEDPETYLKEHYSEYSYILVVKAEKEVTELMDCYVEDGNLKELEDGKIYQVS